MRHKLVYSGIGVIIKRRGRNGNIRAQLLNKRIVKVEQSERRNVSEIGAGVERLKTLDRHLVCPDA